MNLTLTTLRCPDAVPPQTRQVSGGALSIGRGLDNDWVLPDPNRHLSKRHCVLTWRDGAWHLDDTSTNGTFVNFDETPLRDIGPRSLHDGDRVRLGLYEIEVRIAAPAPPPPEPPPPGSPPGPPPGRVARDEGTRISRPGGEGPPADPPGDRVVETWLSGGPFAEEKRDETQVATPLSAPAASADLLAAFLRGAAMPRAAPADPVATMEALGAAFRAVVGGIRQVLLARAAIKSEFRIEQTMIRARGNNPLKFSLSDDDALAALLGVSRRAEMPAAEAVRDALRDMQLHELAVMAAMQSAVRTLVAQFDPAKIRASAEQSGMTLVAAQRKARAWDAFEAQHAKITEALADDFDAVFGRAFALAYEQTLREASARTETF
jgi:type VI secretion system protein ImpI/type VI secretion system protein